MAQMVLPQILVPGAQKDSGPIKSDIGKEASRRESRFEAVSRAEQKRLDQKKAGHADSSQSANDPVENARAETKASATPEGVGAPKSEGTTKKAEQENPDMLENTTPLTFAELQSILIPETPQKLAEGTNTSLFNGPPQLAEGGVAHGLPSNIMGEKTGSQGQGLTALTLTDALAGALTPDGGKDADATNILTRPRFQTALDTASQQGVKLSADLTLPMKGYATSIELPVGHRDWGDKVAGKLSWLTARGMSVAEIHLTPPDMGPMEVKVKLHHDQATVTVHAANPVVRDQLELHSHRLRDMLAEQGVALTQFDVSDSSQQQSGDQAAGDGQGSSGQDSAGLAADGNADDDGLAVGHLDLSWKGEVDVYA